jgi:hypothetical protein
MDIFLIIVGFLFTIIGIIGSFIPVLPGPTMSWIGLLLLHLTKVVENDWWFLGITLAVAILVFALDYIIPVVGTKKFGGSKSGMIGTTIGLLVAIFFPILGIFGIVIWPFVGAYIGEMMHNKDSKNATKAAFGSFLGFLTGTFLKFVVAVIFFGLFVKIVLEHSSSII